VPVVEQHVGVGGGDGGRGMGRVGSGVLHLADHEADGPVHVCGGDSVEPVDVHGPADFRACPGAGHAGDVGPRVGTVHQPSTR